MATTKAATTIQASATNTAGSTTTSSTLDLSDDYGAGIMVKITNGATGPTIACTATCNVSSDGSTWKYFQSATGGTANNGVYQFAFDLPAWVMQAQVVFTGNTGQSVTVEAFAQALTAI
jgi:hypothetical protein